jgi:hypothetical protein
MNALLSGIQQMTDEELAQLSEAIDSELASRQKSHDPIPDSARRRANARQQSYRRSIGASAPPIKAIGLRERRRTRAA